MAGKIPPVYLLGAMIIAGLAFGIIQVPDFGTQAVTGGGGGGSALGSTQNPSLELSCLDAKTQTSNNECTIRALKNGALVKIGTTSSGTVSLTSLDPNTTYTLEVVQPGSSTAFYPFSNTVTTSNGGPVSKALFFSSMQNTAPTPTTYNFDGITGNTTAQAIGTNESGTFRFRVRVASSTNDNNFFSSGPALFVVDYNNTAYSQGISMKNPDGSDMTPSAVPSGHTNVDSNRSTVAAFLSNVSQLKPSTDYDFYLTVKSGNLNPANTADHNSGIRVLVYDQARYQNKAGQYVDSYRNSDTGADLGSTNWSLFANVS